MNGSLWLFIGGSRSGPFLLGRWVIPLGTSQYWNAPMDYCLN